MKKLLILSLALLTIASVEAAKVKCGGRYYKVNNRKRVTNKQVKNKSIQCGKETYVKLYNNTVAGPLVFKAERVSQRIFRKKSK